MNFFNCWKITALGGLLFCLTGGCVSMDTGERPERGPFFDEVLNSAPKVSLFINLKETAGPKLSAQLSEVEIFDGEKWTAIVAKPFWLESGAIGKGQALVARSNLAPGTYSKIRFTVKNAILQEGENNIIFRDFEQTEPQPLSPPLALDDGDSTSLFMNWDTFASLDRAGVSFKASIHTSVQTITLTSELAYVSCPEIDTVYIIRTDRNWVTASWGISGYPSYLAASKERDELYVLANHEAAIKIIELSSGRLKDTVKIPLVSKPFLMVSDPDGQNAYILDQSSNYVYRLEMTSGSLVNHVQLDERPVEMIYLADRQQLAITSLRKIYLLDALNLTTRETIPAGSKPWGLLHHDHKLYVAESSAGTIMTYDLNTANIERTTVGRLPQFFVTHDGFVYVSNHADGSISVLLPDQLSVVKNIRVGGTPARMVVSSLRNWLYAVDPKGMGIAVADLTSQRFSATIELRAQPFALDIIQ